MPLTASLMGLYGTGGVLVDRGGLQVFLTASQGLVGFLECIQSADDRQMLGRWSTDARQTVSTFPHHADCGRYNQSEETASHSGSDFRIQFFVHFSWSQPQTRTANRKPITPPCQASHLKQPVKQTQAETRSQPQTNSRTNHRPTASRTENLKWKSQMEKSNRESHFEISTGNLISKSQTKISI